MKKKSGKKRLVIGDWALIAGGAILVSLSAVSFGLFMNQPLPSTVLLCLLVWVGFSLCASKIYKLRFSHLLIKDSVSFLPFILLPILWFIIKKTGAPNIILYHIFLFIFILSMALFLKARIVPPVRLKNPFSYLLLGILIITYIFIYSFLSYLNYINLSISRIGDFALFNQAFWYTVNGKLLYSQLLGYSFLGAHLSPIILIFAPFYLIWQNPLTILILQTIVIGIGAIPVYLIAKDKLKDNFLALSFSAAYLLHPMTGRVNLLEFHEATFSMPFLLFTFYFLQKEKWRLYLLFLFLSLLVKENISITVTFLGLYIFLIRKRRRMGFATLTIGLLWAYLSVKVVIPWIIETTFFEEGSLSFTHLSLYSHLGGSFSEIIKNLIFHPQKVWESIPCPKLIIFNNLIYFLVPLGFSSLASPLIFLIAIPEFFLQSFSTMPLQYILVSAYPAPIIPFVIISGIYGADRIIRLKKVAPSSFAIYILSLSLLSNFYFSFPALKITTDVVNYEPAHHRTLLSIPLNKGDYQISEQAKIFFEMKRMIPEDAKISATYDLWCYLSGRKTIFPLTEFEKADCIILNTSPTTWTDADLTSKTLNRLLEDKNFRLILNREGLFLFARKGYEEDLLNKAKGLSLSSASPRLHLIIASLYSSLDKIDKAIPEYRIAIEGYLKENPALHKNRLINLHNELAAIFYKKNDIDSAIFELKKIIELDPTHIEARKNLGSFYFLKGEITKAEGEFKEILRLDPENAYAKDMLKKIS